MGTAAQTISVEDYLHRSSKPVCEYLDGVLRPKPMPTKLHALVQFLLVTLLRSQGIEALAEVSVRIAENKFLVPDVIADVRIEDPYPSEPVTAWEYHSHADPTSVNTTLTAGRLIVQVTDILPPLS